MSASAQELFYPAVRPLPPEHPPPAPRLVLSSRAACTWRRVTEPATSQSTSSGGHGRTACDTVPTHRDTAGANRLHATAPQARLAAPDTQSNQDERGLLVPAPPLQGPRPSSTPRTEHLGWFTPRPATSSHRWHTVHHRCIPVHPEPKQAPDIYFRGCYTRRHRLV